MKQKEKIIIIAIIFIIVLFGSCVWAYMTTDFLKTPEQLFKKYLINSVIEISEFNTEPYRTVIERSKKEPTEFTIKAKNELSLDWNWRSIFEKKFGEKMEFLTTVVLKSDELNKNASVSLEIKTDEETDKETDEEVFFNSNFLITDDTFGILIPDLYDKYVALETRDLEKIAHTFELDQEIIENIPEDFEKQSINEEEITKFYEISLKYVHKIVEQIDTELYTKETYIIADFDEKNLHGKKYVLTIPKADFENIMINTFKELMNDQEFLDLLEGKVEEEQIKMLKKEAEEAELVEKDENTEIITISVCESKGKTVRVRYEETSGKRIEITNLNKENGSHLGVEITMPKSENNQVGYDCIIDLKNTYEENNGQCILKVKKTYNDEEKGNNPTSIFSSILNKYDNKEELNYNNIQSYKDIDFTLILATTGNGDEINANLTFEGLNLKNNLYVPEISLKAKVGSEVEVPKLTEQEKIIINDYTRDDFNKLGEEIVKNFQKNATEKPNTFVGIVNKVFNIYMDSMYTLDTSFNEEEIMNSSIMNE